MHECSYDHLHVTCNLDSLGVRYSCARSEVVGESEAG